MKSLFIGFVLSFLVLACSVHALRLTDGLYFTVLPNSTGEVYFILPDDVGIGSGKADYFITTSVNWSVDLTEQTVSTEENNTAIIPIKFYPIGKKEGDCSNYTVSISAPSLKISRTWKGGVCLSKYMDADISKAGGDPKDVLNSNVDLFSIGFRTYMKNSKPGEEVPVEILLQSQASLTIDVTLESTASIERKFFIVQTSQASQSKSLVLNVSASSPGSYEIKVTAKARNCNLASCTKQATMKLVVSDSEPQEGFSVSLFPDNLAVKNLEPIKYSFTIQNNYKEETNFAAIMLDKPFDLESSFIIDTIAVPALSEKTVNFTVMPKNQTGFYEIKISVSSKGTERIASSYLTTNEMVSDVYRNAEEISAEANSSVRLSVNKSVKNWYDSYSKNEYGSNFTQYSSLQDALESTRKQVESSQSQKKNESQVPSGNEEPQQQETGPNYWIFLIPVILGGVVFAVLLMFRKKGNEEDGETLENL